jgi:2-keto-4-pentenoate hydratase/2-oxohepta-3-ene-1,7-dioic acid hydratase in catechol pathway
MRWCRFRSGATGDSGAYGVIEGDTVNMKDGGVVEVEIPGIGVLRNPVVRER